MKKFAIVAAVVVVLIGGAIALVLFNLEGIVNRKKDVILSRVEKALGREVAVEKIGVTIWGGLGVRLERFSIADDPSFAPDPFLTAEDLQVNAKLLPLLRKNFQVKRVVLRKPVISLIRDAEGRLNATTMGAAGRRAEPADSARARAAGEPPALFAVSLVNLEDGEIRFADRAQGLDVRLTQINTRIRELDLRKPIEFELEAAFLAAERNLTASGTVGPLGTANPAAAIPVDVQLSAGPLDVPALIRAFPQAGKGLPPAAKIAGRASLAAKATGTYPDLPASVTVDATEVSIDVPPSFRKPAGVPATLAATVRFEKERILANDLTLKLHTLEASGSAEYRLAKPPSYDLTLRAKETALDGLNQVLPALAAYEATGRVGFEAHAAGTIEKGNKPSVRGTATVSEASVRLPNNPKPLTGIRSTFAFTAESAEVTEAALRMGSTEVRGTAKVEKFAPLRMTFDAASALVSLDDLRPPRPNLKKPEVMRDLAATGRVVMVNNKPDVEGEVRSAAGTLGDIDYQKLRGNFALAGQEVEVSDFSLAALGGTLAGSGRFRIDPQAPAFDFDTKARDVNMVELLEKFPDVTRKFLRAKANLDLDISGSGKEWAAIAPTIKGNGLAELFNGAIVDFNFFNSLAAELTRMTGGVSVFSDQLKNKYPKLFQGGDTEFKELKSTFVIEDGKLLARNLKLDASEFSVVGKGAVDFAKNLDMTATITFSKGFTADVLKSFKEAKYLTNAGGQIEVPLRLSGALPKASVKPDQAYVNQALQKALADKGLNLIKDEGLKSNILDMFGKKKGAAPPDTSSKRP